jgi:hypothetical protein
MATSDIMGATIASEITTAETTLTGTETDAQIRLLMMTALARGITPSVGGEPHAWTPVLGAQQSDPTVSYSNRSGVYYRVGDSLFVSFGLTVASRSGGSGTAVIRGLPFGVYDPALKQSLEVNDLGGIDVGTEAIYFIRLRQVPLGSADSGFELVIKYPNYADPTDITDWSNGAYIQGSGWVLAGEEPLIPGIWGSAAASLQPLTAIAAGSWDPGSVTASVNAILSGLTATGTSALIPDTIFANVAASLQALTVNAAAAQGELDRIDIHAQVLGPDGVTPLTDRVLVTSGTSISTSYQTVSRAFMVQGTPTASDWAGARLKVEWHYLAPSHQSPRVRISTIDLAGTFDPVALDPKWDDGVTKWDDGVTKWK